MGGFGAYGFAHVQSNPRQWDIGMGTRMVLVWRWRGDRLGRAFLRRHRRCTRCIWKLQTGYQTDLQVRWMSRRSCQRLFYKGWHLILNVDYSRDKGRSITQKLFIFFWNSQHRLIPAILFVKCRTCRLSKLLLVLLWNIKNLWNQNYLISSFIISVYRINVFIARFNHTVIMYC